MPWGKSSHMKDACPGATRNRLSSRPDDQESREGKLGAKQVPPRFQGVSVFPLSGEVNCKRALAGRLRQRSSCSVLLFGVHHVTDGWAKTSRILPRVVNPIRECRKHRLELIVKPATEWRREALQSHDFEQERRLDRLAMVVVPIFHHAYQSLPLVAVCLMGFGCFFFMDFGIGFDPLS